MGRGGEPEGGGRETEEGGGVLFYRWELPERTGDGMWMGFFFLSFFLFFAVVDQQNLF